jgi:hypothetical protein
MDLLLPEAFGTILRVHFQQLSSKDFYQSFDLEVPQQAEGLNAVEIRLGMIVPMVCCHLHMPEA